MQEVFPCPSPRDLEGARRKFERWRRGRQRGARIPAELWRAAVDLARRQGVSRTSLALHLDYYALQRRVGGSEAKRRARETEFVELSLPSTAGGARCQVELCDPTGGKVRIDLAGLSATELATFVRTVCGPEP